MAGKKKSPLWRKVFLRALARTGNARASAVEAGIDVGTAYDHRIKDSAFAKLWAGALAKFNPPSRRASADKGSGQAGKAGELVLRRTKRGDKLVRAAPGRWCARTEEDFFAALGRTGCVRAAAAAAGISANALYYRRGKYPEFAEKWDAVEAQARQRIPSLLTAATIASLDPDAAPAGAGRGRGRLPKIDVDQAIRISAIEARKEAGGRRRGRDWREVQRRHEETQEELVQQLMTMLDAMDRRQRKARLGEGWSDAGNGLLVPPGWVYGGTQQDVDGAGDVAAAEDGDSHA